MSMTATSGSGSRIAGRGSPASAYRAMTAKAAFVNRAGVHPVLARR